MKTQHTRICRACRKEKSLDEMESFQKGNKTYYRRKCKSCERKRKKKWQQDNSDKVRANSERQSRKKSRQREGLEEQEKFILWDTRGSDRKAARKNDLTKDFIRELIFGGCCYCGENSIRMTLDRIDNKKGHTQKNVVPACIRCNYLRGNMPHEAWLIVSQGVKSARKKGLFGTWTGRVTTPSASTRK